MSEQFKSIETTELIKIANAIRVKTGNNEQIALKDMPDKIRSIEGGGIYLPELEFEGSSADLLAGKQLIDGDGNIVEGTITTKTESNLTVNGATVTVPSGYYATQATKSVATATQATPSIDVDSSGLITASTTQTSGYVSGGTKSATKWLTTQGAKSITPTTSSQTAVASGVYTTGDITVEAIPSEYTITSDATATAADILSGETAYVNGEKVTGTIVTKTSDDLTASGATVTVPAGYYTNDTTKSVSTATQATPSITVNSSGLITATATQTTGYVAAGTKSATKQLAFQAAKTITPKATSQIAVSSGYYTGGDITVAGDSNLVAGNIKSGVSIFGVAGSYEGEGGGDTSVEDNLVTVAMTTYTNSRVNNIGQGAFAFALNLTTISFPKATSIYNSAFYGCTKLSTISFPEATYLGVDAFRFCYSLTTVSLPKASYIDKNVFFYCTNLTTVSLPEATRIGSYAFDWCSNLTTVSLPKVTSIYSEAFYGCAKLSTISLPEVTYIDYGVFLYCSNLTTVNLPKATSIGKNAFDHCYKLISLYLNGSSICILSNSYTFISTPIGGYSTSAGRYGSIFVPASLLASYKAATNWVYFSSRFVGI